MKNIFSDTLLTFFLFTACNSSESKEEEKTPSSSNKKQSAASGSQHWQGTFSNGMKGAKISFDTEANELQNLTFEGYWRCDGKLDLTTIGPEKSFALEADKVDGIIIEPEDGPAPFRFELHGSFDGDKAEGTLRISNIPAGCDTYKLNWTAEKE